MKKLKVEIKVLILLLVLFVYVICGVIEYNRLLKKDCKKLYNEEYCIRIGEN